MPVFLLPIITAASNALRLPALAAFLAGIFAQVVGFFAKWFTKNTAMQLGIITAVSSVTIAMVTAIKSLILSLNFVLPPMYIQAMSLIVPDSLPVCFSAIVSAKVVRWVWSWQVRYIEYYAGVR
ncbi:DUF5455 family protein [Marinomonas gallaica]|uniref:DUF5455 family protein n=1 Tax=Marinomonas gallaica TaxID=1806667 RepID=UPI00082AE7E6|nr:DUF5455 family protein [Marinomonas gallaica]